MARKSSVQLKRDARTQRRREQTRTEILGVARKIIVRDGARDFAVSSVAEELGLTKPAIYYYFRSKEALIFDLWLGEMMAVAEVVKAAVDECETGADGVEAMMRSFFQRYRDQLELFTFCYRMGQMVDAPKVASAEDLERIRPTNDMFYGGVERLLLADQRAGRFPKKRNARRFAFTAHTTVIGLLNMLAMVAPSGDALIHSDDELIDEVCQTFRDSAQKKGAK